MPSLMTGERSVTVAAEGLVASAGVTLIEIVPLAASEYETDDALTHGGAVPAVQFVTQYSVVSPAKNNLEPGMSEMVSLLAPAVRLRVVWVAVPVPVSVPPLPRGKLADA